MEKFPEKNPNPVLCVSKDGTVLYSNKAGEPLLNEWGTKIGEKLPSYIGNFVQKVISQNIPGKMEVKVGKRVFLAEFHSLLEDECVNIYGFDISDQKELEEKLRESEERLLLAQQVAKIGTFEWNLQTGVNIWTPEMEAMYGLLPREFGKTQTAWEKLVHPDDRSKALCLVDLALQTGEPIEGEWRVFWSDGSVHWLTGRWQVFKDATGKPLRMTGVNIDITERKQTEKAWQDSKARVDSIFRSSPIGIGVVVDRMIKEANERLCEMTGYSREELLGMNALMLYPTVEEYERVGRVKYGMIAQSGTGHVETRWRRKDGSVVDIILSSSPIIPGDLSREITFTALDITERKRVEKALRESEARFRSYFEMPLVGILITSLDKGVISVNDKFCTLVGYSADELKGTTWDKITHPEDLARDVEQFNQVLAGEIDSYTMEKRFIHKNGTSIPTILSVGCVRRLDHTVNYLVTTVQDITERKRAEEELCKSENRFRAMFEEHGAPMLLIEPNSGQIINANEAAARFYEYSREQLRAMYIDQINQLPPEEVAAERYKAIEHSKNVFVFTHRLASGDERLVEVYSSPVTIEGQPMLFSIIHDITLRKKAEEALKKAHENLEEKVKERTEELEIAYESLRNLETVRKQEIHHRIKNNLQVISSLLDLEAEKFRSKKNIEDSQVIEAFKESQDRVISMALIHEKLHKGEQINTLNISHYIEELANNLLLTYSVCNNDISLDMDIEEDIFFDMDMSVPLGIIINELISNSLKHAFSGRDKGEIQIKLHREKSGECESEDCNLTYVLMISDNGIGIPKDLDIENLDSLGLQLVTSLVNQLDGEFELKSNNGTEFIIRFTVKER